jgi:hypothetical protein
MNIGVLLLLFLCAPLVAPFRYLGTTITNQNLIQEEIKERLNSGNACYHLVQNLLSSRLLSNNIKIRILSCILGTLQVINRFRISRIDLLDMHQAELQLVVA